MFHPPTDTPMLASPESYYDDYQSYGLPYIVPSHHTSYLDGVCDDVFELDVRQPLFPSDNRFEILADRALRAYHTAALESRPAYQTASHPRRTRNSRGTKEGKRRRDARRKKAKHDAQKLDEQLSLQLDALFKNVVTYHDSPFIQAASPVPSLELVPQTPSSLRHTSSLQARLPLMSRPKLAGWHDQPVYPHFQDFSSAASQLPDYGVQHMSFSNAAYVPESDVRGIWLTHVPGMQAPPPSAISGELPSWCPPLPAFNQSNLWLSGQPVFHDLSSLPESAESPRSISKTQGTQIWRPRFEKRQSRFFPTRYRSQPLVKLPVLSHTSIRQSHSTKIAVPECLVTDSKPLDLASSVKRVVAAAKIEHSGAERTLSTAANLWSILSSQGQPEIENNDLSYQKEALSYASCNDNNTETPDPCFELDNTAVPYVHANSLLGIANEIATSPYAAKHAAMVDSATYLPRQNDDHPLMIGMNELLVDHDVDLGCSLQNNDTSLPPFITEADVVATEHSLVSGANDDSSATCIDCANFIDHEVDEASGVECSDAHFRGERELFAPQDPATMPSVESTIDIATFLKMGHGKVCWCRDCESVPELVSADMANDDDDDWTVCTPGSEDGMTIDGADLTEHPNEYHASKNDMDNHELLITSGLACLDNHYRLHGISEEDWIFDCDM